MQLSLHPQHTTIARTLPQSTNKQMFELYSESSSSIENEKYTCFYVSARLDEIRQKTEAVRSFVTDLNRVGKVVKLAAFSPFDSARDALRNLMLNRSCQNDSVHSIT